MQGEAPGCEVFIIMRTDPNINPPQSTHCVSAIMK